MGRCLGRSLIATSNFPALRLTANKVEESLINAELVAIDIQRVLPADESKTGTELCQVWAIRKVMASQWRVPELLRSNVWEQWLRPFLCWLRVPRLELLRGSALGFQKLANYMARHYSKPAESGPDYTPNAVSLLTFSRPRAGTSPTSVCGSMASTGGGQDGTAALQTRPGCPWLDRHYLEQAGFLTGVCPGHANDGDGHIRHQQPARLQQTRPITERLKTRPLNCSQSSSARPNSATTARNSPR